MSNHTQSPVGFTSYPLMAGLLCVADKEPLGERKHLSGPTKAVVGQEMFPEGPAVGAPFIAVEINTTRSCLES